MTDAQRDSLFTLMPPHGGVREERFVDDSRAARGGGQDYEFDARVSYTSRFSDDKQEMYAQNVRDALCDVVRAMRDPGHHIKASLEAGVASLRMATAVNAP